MVSSVVFPDPDGPMIRVISPASVVKLTPSTALTCPIVRRSSPR